MLELALDISSSLSFPLYYFLLELFGLGLQGLHPRLELLALGHQLQESIELSWVQAGHERGGSCLGFSLDLHEHFLLLNAMRVQDGRIGLLKDTRQLVS